MPIPLGDRIGFYFQKGEGMNQPPSIERHLIRVLVSIACVAILGVLAILPYRLYERDIRNARLDAHQVASVVHAAISSAVMQGQDISDLMNRLQGNAALNLKLSRIEKGEVHPVVTSGKASSELRGTQLTYIAPPIVDQKGDTWLATMEFDLSGMKRESVRLIIDLVLAVVVGSTIFSLVVFFLIRFSLLRPLDELRRRVELLGDGQGPVRMPRFGTSEMTELVAALEKACDTHFESD